MRTTLKWTLRLAVAVVALSSCGDGPAGPTGPTGPSGPSGTAGTDGANGTNGTNGQNCTVAGYDGGVTVTCPGSNPVNVPNGPSGQDCTVAQFDGGVTVTCPGSAPVIVRNGTDASALVDYAVLTASEIALLDPSVTVTSVSSAPRPVVALKITDAKGRGIKNVPPAFLNGFALMKLVPGTAVIGGSGLNVDTWVSYIANCATCVSSTETASATTLVGLGDGSYTYTFLKNIQAAVGNTSPGTTYAATAPHRLLFRLAASGNAFRPFDLVYDWLPSTGAEITGANEKVSTANCLECHGSFRANALNAGGATAFHGGQRYLVPFCFACHNDQRKYAGTDGGGNAIIAEPTITAGVMTPPAGQTSVKVLKGEAMINMPVWIHKIHRGEHLALRGPYPGGAFGQEMTEIFFPQDLRNCTKCHKNAPLADNWKNKPSARACGSCHDNVDLTAGTNHLGGPQASDANCAVCHTATMVAAQHLPVAAPDPNNALLITDGGGNNNTHAAWMANPNNRPDGGYSISYAMPTGAVTAVANPDGGLNARVNFRMVKEGANVVFNTWDGGNEMLDNYFGSTSVYCAFAVPQDNIAAPADFNATASVYLKNLWKGTAAGILAGPDGTGNYTVTLTGTNLPTSATMLTCGVGYSYSLSSTQPLTQTNVPGYAFDPATRTGGLIVPAPNLWQVAAGYTGRRGSTTNTAAGGQIVTTAKCESCHNPLGVTPSFHAGQRNDGPTCSFCHTSNRTSSGWSAASETFIHAVHGAGKRTIPFNWHATSQTAGFYNVTFPGRPQNCETCHTPGFYDFSSPWYTANNAANLATRPPFTVGQGIYNSSPTTNPKGFYSISPYVVADGVTNYGNGFSYNTGTGVTVEAAPTTLVSSPITGSCFACHDSSSAMGHMRTNGGSIYAPRSQALATTEQCLICHGPGKLAAIKAIHYQ